jgi:hypothetical protein
MQLAKRLEIWYNLGLHSAYMISKEKGEIKLRMLKDNDVLREGVQNAGASASF